MTRRPLVTAVLAAVFLVVAATPAAAAAAVDHWAMEFLHIREANAISQGAGVIVAVIDTGVDAAHPDLAGSVLAGYNPEGVGSPDATSDLDGHGTAMAGLIAAHGTMYGVAPQAKILPIRSNLSTSMPKSIDWAVDHGAKIISVSQIVSSTTQLQTAVTRALDAGVVIVVGAGNTPLVTKPEGLATYQGVITVGGVNRTGGRASNSVRGAAVVLAAPGEDIDSTGPGGTYRNGTGTSDATALVSGVAALMKAKFPNLSGQEIYHRLIATADDKGAPGRDDEFGYGIVNPVKALTADVPPLTTSGNPTNATTGTGSGDDGGGPLPLGVILGLVAGVVLVIVVVIVLATRRRS